MITSASAIDFPVTCAISRSTTSDGMCHRLFSFFLRAQPLSARTDLCHLTRQDMYVVLFEVEDVSTVTILAVGHPRENDDC
jgi:hypothetical protein